VYNLEELVISDMNIGSNIQEQSVAGSYHI